MATPTTPTDHELHAFLNRVRSVFNIDQCDIPEFSPWKWGQFQSDPIRYLMRCSDEDAAVIWREVQKRQRAPEGT